MYKYRSVARSQFRSFVILHVENRSHLRGAHNRLSDSTFLYVKELRWNTNELIEYNVDKLVQAGIRPLLPFRRLHAIITVLTFTVITP
jgi:hypothetical protein